MMVAQADAKTVTSSDDSLEYYKPNEPWRLQQPSLQNSTSQGSKRGLLPFPWSPDKDTDLKEEEEDPYLTPIEHQTPVTWVRDDANTASNDMNTTSRQMRRSSSLVANNSSLDVSWFARRGIMSTDSFERYEEEMKQNVIKGASSNNLLDLPSSATNKKATRKNDGASTGTRCLRNDDFEVALNNKGNRQRGQSNKPMHEVDKSLSLDAGLDNLVKSFISSFRDGDEQGRKKSARLIQSKLEKNDSFELQSGLSSEELHVLTKMVRRLSGEHERDANIDRISSMETLPRSNHRPKFEESFQTARFEQSDTTLLYSNAGNDGSQSISSLLSSQPCEQALALPTLRRGDSETDQKILSNKMDITPSNSHHPLPEVALTRDQSITSALTLPPLENNISLGTISTGTNTSTKPLKTSFNRSDTLSTCFSEEKRDVVNDMGERPDFDDRDFARTPSMPRIRRNTLSSESMGRRPSITDLHSRRRQSVATYDDPQLKEDCGDLLAEGMEYLSMAMLVNIYGKLREMSLLGHVSVKLRDIDVNSHQYNSRKKELKRLELWTAADEAKGYLDTTRNAGFIVRTVMDEHELFEAEHARGADNGANQAFLAYDASLLKDFKTWVEESRVKQLDSATEGIIRKIREECYKRQIEKEKMISSNQLKSPFGSSSSVADIGLSLSRRRGSLMDISESFQGASWMEQERKLIEDHFGMRNGLPTSRREPNRIASLSGTDLSSSLISKAIEDSTDCFFEEGSVMKNLLKSGFEVVWFADRHPKDITYGICVNRDTATVSVVFRGQEGIFDLCRDTTLSSFPNPIAHEDYEGNSETIKLRSALADEILRVRLDTKMSLISEIREKIVIIGQELANLTDGAGYHLSVVGHSRGGGYATILGYYLASDMYLDLASAVRVFTYAASPVGNTDFLNGFKHLEEQGRLLHARFANSNDLSSSLPLKGYSEETDMKETYQHVGMQVRLHKANEAGRRRIKQSLDVCYGAKEPILREMARCVINVLCPLKALLCFVFYKNQCVSQYHLRMHFAREYRLALGDGALRFDKKRKYLKTLNEYYIMKCRNVHDFTWFYDKGSVMPTWAVFVVVACLLMLQIDIFFKFSAGWYSC